MSGVPTIEEAIRSFLDTQQEGANRSDSEMATLLLEFSALLFENPEEGKSEEILIHHLGSFELDEFLNFYLQDMHPDDAHIVKKGKEFLKKFRKFLDKRSLLAGEQKEDWKEFFQENGI
ncbi:hypothetical protein ACE5IS_07380 [Leptospira wolffii]|uniref:Uncharacterized protein n=1 Tax=Leptospira wolffii TaxID=409998 RepID=A0A2M9Z8L7_9LEPT|nr:hypothetical protein [Leptospira wolffii]EPG66773.1 hypothetical protein LEP1GSC061_1743 [Leptospira wolffii serovar Khorat str. Khorat-H2]PJZ64763.1 hypothetical protein CH371_16725 [Leptospira wolffii]TGK56942.1 hypothetical protein EHQ32_15310 [Leptospira wolffii]TGK70975.1 hypothetical protein EHQ27_11230 [Leptospira wolffii]TGK75666.1 hypothetical protein EHQ35_04680 [Leptospira wolffii]